MGDAMTVLLTEERRTNKTWTIEKGEGEVAEEALLRALGNVDDQKPTSKKKQYNGSRINLRSRFLQSKVRRRGKSKKGPKKELQTGRRG